MLQTEKESRMAQLAAARPARLKRCDPQALPVAQAALEASAAELVILFGSRARGDYNPQRSDIDLLMLQAEEPDEDDKIAIRKAAAAAARVNYGKAVPIQLVWSGLAEFRQQRRYINSLETKAVKDGIVMPRNPEDYGLSEYEDEAVEQEYDWTPYGERLRHAEDHLKDLQIIDANGGSDNGIGQHAQRALEHGMKALLEAHQADYRGVHNLGELLGNIRYRDQEMADFHLSIPPQVYNAYEGGDEYKPRRQPRLTTFPDYLARTVADAQAIISRAKQVREQKQQEEQETP